MTSNQRLYETMGHKYVNSWQRWKGIMKCYPFEEKRLAKWSPPYIVQPKYDGVRCRAIPLDAGGYILLSSEENILFSVPHIQDMFSDSPLDIELDGELYCHGMGFSEILSITSRTVNLHPDHKLIKFHCFDIIEPGTQTERILKVSKLADYHLPHLEISPYWICNSLDDIMRVYDRLIELNYEGIIVRHTEAPYIRKRSTWVMKFKAKKEDEYEILGYEEEISITGRFKNSLGSLTCRSGDGNVFSVGTGFTKESRQTLWNTKESLIGKIAKVQYQHLTSGKKVPRFPVFVEVI